MNDAGDKEKGSDVESSQPHIINGHVPNGKLKVSDGDNIVIVTDKSRPSNATTAGSNAANVAAPHSWQVAVTALGKLGLIMAYFYLCDRQVVFFSCTLSLHTRLVCGYAVDHKPIDLGRVFFHFYYFLPEIDLRPCCVVTLWSQ